MVKKLISVFIKGLLAGFAISLGGFIFIMTKKYLDNHILASYLFATGLILVCNFGYFLYTGKVCYLFDELKKKEKPNYIVQLIIGYLGNVLGAFLVAFVLKNILVIPELVEGMINARVVDSWYGLILKGALCGILIYLAVEGFKNSKTDIGKYVVLVLCVGAFIICGFEHSIADAFYFGLGDNLLSTIPALLLITLGNTIGGLLFPAIKLLIEKLEK